MKIEHVKGKKKSKVMLYALSTCGWCRKTKELLDKLGVEYDYVFVDLASQTDSEEIMKQARKWNPAESFPTMVIDDKDCIVGFREDEITKRLG